METDLSAYAAQRRLRDTTLARLRVLGATSCRAALDFAKTLGLNDNQLNDFLDLLGDIAARRQCDVAVVLADEAIADIARRPLGRSDRIRETKAVLRRLRYPQLSAALERIDRLRGELGLPRGSRLELPDNLEGDEIVVTIRASSVAQLRGRVDEVARAVARPEVETIFSIWQEADG